MINWFERIDPVRPFLKTAERTWTYGESLTEIRSRIVLKPGVVRPQLDADGVFDLLAGIAGNGVIVLGPCDSTPGEVDLSGAALVVYTSGTSGARKGVRLTLPNLIAASRASVEHLGHGSGDTWLLAMPLSHVAGISVLVRSAYAGGSVRMLASSDPVRWIEAMKDDVDVVSMVPTMLRRILEVGPGEVGGVKTVLVGGGPIPDGLLERATEAGLPVLPTYGMTETFGQLATLRSRSTLLRHVHPLPGVDLRIEDDGRIAFRGSQVSPGYLGEADRENEWFVSNDLGVLDSDGALRVVSRADNVIVTGGENVDPTLVENEILGEEGVDDVVVVGVADETWGQLVTALYVGTASSADISEALANRLPRYLVPARWMRVMEIPKTDIGKPDRAAASDLAMRHSS